MFRTLWHTVSTEILVRLALAAILVLLGFMGVSSIPRLLLTALAIALLIVIWRLRYARRNQAR